MSNTRNLIRQSIQGLEILKMTSLGYSNEEIAAAMNVSKATIYAHRTNILAKSDANSIPKLIENLRFKGVLSSLMLCISSFSELIGVQPLILSFI